MYKCQVEMRILDDSPEPDAYTALCYQLEVEQAPVLGQELRENRWFSGPIVHILWDAENECFYARVRDEKPHFRGTDEFSHDWLVSNYKQQGWVECDENVRRVG